MTATALQQEAQRAKRRQQIGGWLFVAPVLLLNLIVVVIPSAIGLGMAFTDWSGVGSMNFIGLANFQRLFQDGVFFKALTHNLLWTAFFLIVPVALGLLGAYLLSGIKRGQMFFRVAYFIPYVIAAVVNTQLWRYLLNPRVGIGPALSQCCGIEFLNVPVFGSRDLALLGVAFVDMWHFWGFLLVLYLAAMSGVDIELYEVARLDGAGRWAQFRHVTLPSIRPTLVFTILMITIWSGLVFDYVFIITGGGPANASEVMGTLLYTTAFQRFEAGYAAAIGIFMALWVAIATGGFVLLRKLGWEV